MLQKQLLYQAWKPRNYLLPRFSSATSMLMLGIAESSDPTGGISISFLLLSSMFLAVISTVFDSTRLVVWISNKLSASNVDEEETPIPTKPRVRNPLTDRLIDIDGPTHRKLVKRGILPSVSGDKVITNYGTDPTAGANTAGWSFRELTAGDGILPSDGSIAVVRLTARISSPAGPVVALAGGPPGEDEGDDDHDGPAPPFAFEVGDPAVLRGLDAAVRRMREGARAALTLPPPYGYTPARRLPPPLRAAPAAAGETLYVDIRLDAVLALPPPLLSGGGGGGGGGVVPAKVLQGLLIRDPDGRYRLDTGRLGPGSF